MVDFSQGQSAWKSKVVMGPGVYVENLSFSITFGEWRAIEDGTHIFGQYHIWIHAKEWDVFFQHVGAP